MRVIFLDVDGVLNCNSTRQKIPFTEFLGIEDNKVDLLSRLVKECGAVVVLSSSWKRGWDRDAFKCEDYGTYLDLKLGQYGVHIYDKTPDSAGWNRGHEIAEWMEKISLVENIEGYVILDDEYFADFKEYNLGAHLVRTSWKDGLQKKHIKRAKDILMGKNLLSEEEQEASMEETDDHWGMDIE